MIKTLGDSVLFVSEEPARAMDIGLSIVDVIGTTAGCPTYASAWPPGR